MAAEVDEVEGAEFAADLDDAHIAPGAGENGDAGDIGALTRKLAKSGSMKDATALRLAKLRARE